MLTMLVSTTKKTRASIRSPSRISIPCRPPRSSGMAIAESMRPSGPMVAIPSGRSLGPYPSPETRLPTYVCHTSCTGLPAGNPSPRSIARQVITLTAVGEHWLRDLETRGAVIAAGVLVELARERTPEIFAALDRGEMPEESWKRRALTVEDEVAAQARTIARYRDRDTEQEEAIKLQAERIRELEAALRTGSADSSSASTDWAAAKRPPKRQRRRRSSSTPATSDEPPSST